MTNRPPLTASDLTWQADANCRDEDLELFFPHDDEISTTAGRRLRDYREATAKAVCRECPVIDACLNHALRIGEAGVWGGTTEEERRRWQKNERRRRAAS